MSRISPEALQEVRQAVREYKETVEATNLAPTSKHTYINHAENFVRWLANDFEPGSQKG